MYVDEIELFTKSEKEFETLIQPEKSGKRQMTTGIELRNQKKNQTTQRKVNLQYRDGI